MLMCPEREKRRSEGLHHQINCDNFSMIVHVGRRQREKSIHVLEVSPDVGRGVSEVIAVKEYVRAGAGHSLPHPDDLRPPDVLVKTMEYLIWMWVPIFNTYATGVVSMITL